MLGRIPLFVCALISVAGVRAQQPAAPHTRTAHLQIIGVDGLPVAGAGVCVAKYLDVRTDDALQRPAARSGADGRITVAVPWIDGPPSHLQATLLVAAPGLMAASFSFPYGTTGDHDFGVVCLLPGTILRGRVRGENNKPLAGVRVNARETGIAPHHWSTSTVTDEKGVYALRCAPRGVTSLSFYKPGYYVEKLFPVRPDSPVAPTLQRSGFISGRLLGLDPSKVELRVQAQAADYFWVPSTLAADGSFRLPVVNRRAVQLQVGDWQDRILLQPEPVAGPCEGLELKAVTVPLTVAVTRGGKPVPAFDVVAAWNDERDTSAWRQQYPIAGKGEPGQGGVLVVKMPASASLGVLYVSAPGCATTRVAVPIPGDGSLEVDLEPAGSIVGKVVDADGRAVAGAEVFAQRLPRNARMSFTFNRSANRLLTAADGSFEIGALTKAEYVVQVEHSDYALPKGLRCKVEAGKVAKLEPLSLAPSPIIKGTIIARGLRPGCTVREARAGFSMGMGEYRYTRQRTAVAVVDARTGKFELRDLDSRRCELELVMPASHANCQPMRFLLGEFTPGAEPIKIEGPDLRLSHVRGKLIGLIPSGATAGLRVVALEESEKRFGRPRPYNAADVAADGSFDLLLPPGKCPLVVEDAVSAIRIARVDDVVVVAGQDTNLDIPVELRAVTFELAANLGGGAPISLWVRGEPDNDESRALLLSLSYLNKVDQQQRLSLALPEGAYRVKGGSVAKPNCVDQVFDVRRRPVTVQIGK